jgi:tetratricopeptide (TPR) repeat protein
MHTHRLSITLAIAAAAATLFATTAHAQTDQIFARGGAPISGRVTEMGRDQVTLEVSGVGRPFQVNEIQRIRYGDEPTELGNARNAVLQRNYNLALSELRKLDGRPAARDLVQQDIEFYKALCLARQAMTEGGDKNAAMAAMRNFARVAPQNYHFYEAAEVLGDLAMAAGRFPEAEQFYRPLSEAPWADYKMRANIAIGRAQIAQKKFDEALSRFEDVIRSEQASPEAAQQKLLATAGKAVCLAETGKPDDGIALLNDIIAKNDPENKALFARVYNALGVCQLRAGRPKEAVIAFLHTDILYFEEPDAHAEALYHLSKLWSDVNRSDRAVAARNTLRERYAGSVWAAVD